MRGASVSGFKRARRAFKDALIEAGAWSVSAGLDRGPVPIDALASLRPRRVLLVRSDRLGDLLVCTPLIAGLARLWPAAELVLVGGAKNRSLMPLLPYVRRATVEFARHPAAWARLAWWIPRQRFDVAVGLRAEVFSSAWLCARARAPVRVVVNATPALPAFNAVVGWSDPHHVRRYWSVARHLGVASAEPRPEVVIPESAEREAAQVWRELAPDGGPVAGVAVPNRSTGRHARRALAASTLVEVVRALRRDGVGVAVFGFGSELPEAGQVAAAAPGAVLAPALPIPVLAAVLRRLSLYVSGFTGPLHLADAVGCATVSTGPTGVADGWGPLGPAHRSIAAADATTIDAGAVVGAARALLGRRSKPALSRSAEVV